MPNSSRYITLRTTSLTIVAMLAFAANSLLCRLALGQRLIDPASFASVRMISGAVVLAVIILARRSNLKYSSSWRSVLALFAYMVLFSFAYRWLSAGTGALILFGAVQLTMFSCAIRAGERFSAVSWAGVSAAIIGLIFLVLPGVTAPDPFGAALMAIAGIAWGFYSLLGRGAADPVVATAGNFIYSVPLVAAVSLLSVHDFSVSSSGLLLAMASGAVASGCGYVVWYAALPSLTASRAATVQLSVPVIAALGGVALISEQVTLRLLLASAVTLGGVALVFAQRTTKPS